MARKEYTPEVAQLEGLKKLNSKLAGHCDIYALRAGMIYLKSNISFVEKVGIVRDPQKISQYDEMMVNVPELRGYLSGYKKTTARVEVDPKGYYFTDEKDDTRRAYVPSITKDEGAVWKQLGSLYQHYLHGNDLLHQQLEEEIFKFDAKIYDLKQLGYSQLNPQCIIDMKENKTIGVRTPKGADAYITKALFGSNFNHTEAIFCKDLEIKSERKRYVLFLQVEPEFYLFTVIAVLAPIE